MINKTESFKRIRASLHHGQVLHKGMMCIFVFLIVVSTMTLIIAFAVIASYCCSGKTFQSSDITVLAGASIIAFLTLCGSIIVISNRLALKKNIYLWLNDAVELCATAIVIDSIGWGLFASTKLEVTFIYNDRLYSFCSGDPLDNSHIFIRSKGYYRVLSRYADKNVTILFSPTYNEILFLDNVAQK